ncbi:MAG: hypothetical protein QM766_13870 [Burkholderiaceae bacterium]
MSVACRRIAQRAGDVGQPARIRRVLFDLGQARMRDQRRAAPASEADQRGLAHRRERPDLVAGDEADLGRPRRRVQLRGDPPGGGEPGQRDRGGGRQRIRRCSG